MISNKEEIIKHLRNYFEKNADKFRLEMVFLYGSWVRGLQRNDSDIEISVLVFG